MVKHRSVSQLSTYSKCGEQYRLQKVEHAPSQPAAWFHQGTAFHKAVELWEKSSRSLTPQAVLEIFYAEYDRLVAADMEREPNLARWLTGGRVKASDDINRRRAKGAEQVLGYLSYAQLAPERPWLLWGAEPALEVEFSLDLDGIEVIGFIDTIVQWPTGQVGPRDWKTGTRRPDWPLQLGVYRIAIEDMFGFLPAWGDFYMAKDNAPDPPVDLTAFTRERVTRWFHDMDRAVKAGIFLPNPGDGCRTCGVYEFCSAIGPRASEYPPIP